MKARSGFTLIELLVVIAIIAILAAILFPVFAKAREKARQISCESNMKQLGLGVLQYEQDYDEQMPASADIWGEGWAGHIYPYVKSTGVFGCPDDPTQPVAGRYKVSYGLNGNLTRSWQGTYYNDGQTLQAIAQQNSPSNTVLLFELQNQSSTGDGQPGVDVTNVDENSSSSGLGSISGGCNGSMPNGNYCHAKYATGNISGYPLTNWSGTLGVHTDGANYAALDGHAKWLRPSQVSGGETAFDQNNKEVYCTSSKNCGTAAGTNSMTANDGTTKVALTFSPT